jgi:hypothetical protein
VFGKKEKPSKPRRLSDSEIEQKLGSMRREDAGEAPDEGDEELAFDEVTDVMDYVMQKTRAAGVACAKTTAAVVKKIDQVTSKIEEKKA